MPSVIEKHQLVIRGNSMWTSWASISKDLNIIKFKRIKFLHMLSGKTKIRNIDIFSNIYLALKDGVP